MRQSKLVTAAVFSVMAYANGSYAAEEAENSPWTVTANIGYVSDYYFRGISQNWHKPTAQGGVDVTHSSGFYAGTWASSVTPNTYPDATTEIDVYGGYNGTVPWVDKMGYTVGLYGYMYPGGSWSKYTYTGVYAADGSLAKLTPKGGDWDSLELNAGLSYDWFSVKGSYMLTSWFGATKTTGWTRNTRGTAYIEANANYPLPWWNLTLVGHLGHLMVNGRLDPNYVTGVDAAGKDIKPSDTTEKTSPNYVDWKLGLSKAFKIASADGFNAGLYFIGSSNRSYWSSAGYGGSSFDGAGPQEFKNLYQTRAVFTVGRTF